MYINAQKSKTTVVSRQDNISVQVDHEGEPLEQVQVVICCRQPSSRKVD